MIEQGLLDALGIPADDPQLAGVGVAAVLIELVLLDEFRRHELIDEIHVVVDPPDLENFLPAEAQAFVPVLLLAEVFGFLVFLAELALVPAIFDVAEQLDADLVRIEIPRRHVNRAAVMVGIVDDFRGIDKVLGHQRGMPVGGPAFVHDLGHRLRGIVVALFADDAEAVGLPVFQPGMLQQVEQDVARRAGGRDVAHLGLVVA